MLESTMRRNLCRSPIPAFSALLLIFFAGLSLIPSSLSAQQLAILKKIPPELLPYTGGGWPDEKGMVGHNRDGFHSPELQRGAMQIMLRSIAAGNRKGLEAGWRAIDATFAHQTEVGNFARDGGPVGGPSAAAFWLCELDQAVLVLRESEFAAEYKDRIDKLIPKIHQAARWMAQEKYQERLKREDAETPNRLLFDALAYGLSGLLADDRQLQSIGRQFVAAAMKHYRESDGVFLEKGGHDTSYQAVAALKLQVWITYFPDKELEAAAEKAVKWEVSRIEPDGQIDVAENTAHRLESGKMAGQFQECESQRSDLLPALRLRPHRKSGHPGGRETDHRFPEEGVGRAVEIMVGPVALSCNPVCLKCRRRRLCFSITSPIDLLC